MTEIESQTEKPTTSTVDQEGSTMKQFRNTALTIAAGVALAITAFAQQPTTGTDQPNQGMQMHA